MRYFTWGNAFSDGIEQKVIEAFHAKQSRVKIEFTNSQNEHFTKLSAAIAGGDPPDTALVDGYDIRALVKRGGAQDVTARMQKDGVKKEDYVESWFDEFLPRLAAGEPRTLFEPAFVSDRADGKIGHLDGLNLSRAWCWRHIAAAVTPGHAARLLGQEAAARHLAAALPHLTDNYMGEHWLATFALLALEDPDHGN